MKRVGGWLFLMAASIGWHGNALPAYVDVKASYQSSELRIVDSRGSLLQQTRLSRERRSLRWVGLDAISPALIDAVLRAEDKRFYSHGGVDWRAMLSAAVSAAHGRATRGASTITMQLGSMLRHPRRRPARRGWWEKVQQIRDAWDLEKGWSKRQILEAYLNLVSFRGELLGIEAASRGLFGKEPHGLSEAEGLVLAALIRSPNAAADPVARRACGLTCSRAVCDDVKLVSRALLHPYFLASPADLAPQVADLFLSDERYRQELGPRASEVRTTLRADLQRFVRDTLDRHLMAVRSQNVQDGAALVVDNRTGEVLAYVSRAGDPAAHGWVDGVRGRRQAGSTLKPFLYAEALQRRLLTAASLLDDSPLEVSAPRGVYRPGNYDNQFHGLVPLRTALASSLNIPAVRTVLLVGEQNFATKLSELGFGQLRDGDYYGPSIALGSVDITLWELVGAYRALANHGRYAPIRLTPNETAAPARDVYDPAVTFIVSDILADRASRSLTFGLENALSTRFWTAAKTGTSKDMRDNWCVGFSDRYTVGVWAGNFSGEAMWNVSGITGAAPVWIEIMNHLHAVTPSRAPAVPPGVVRRAVAIAPDPVGRPEYFLAGTEEKTIVPKPRVLPWKIRYPTADLILALDPDIPTGQQKVFFEAQQGEGTPRWNLDGKDLGRADELVAWGPSRGVHVLSLEDARGVAVDSVRFQVRGGLANR